jgi:hypothetical protein
LANCLGNRRPNNRRPLRCETSKHSIADVRH